MAGNSFTNNSSSPSSNNNNNNSNHNHLNNRKKIPYFPTNSLLRLQFGSNKLSTPKILNNNHNKIIKKKNRLKMSTFRFEERERFKKILSDHVKKLPNRLEKLSISNSKSLGENLDKQYLFIQSNSKKSSSPFSIQKQHNFMPKSLSLVDLVKYNGFVASSDKILVEKIQNKTESKTIKDLNEKPKENTRDCNNKSRLLQIEQWKLPEKSSNFKSSIENKFNLLYTPPNKNLIENNKTNIEDGLIYEKFTTAQILKNDRQSIQTKIKSLFEPFMSHNFFCKFKRFIPYTQRDHEISEEAKLDDVIEVKDDIENELNDVLYNKENKLLVSAYKINIHTKDLQTLSGSRWLNDAVIEFYLNLIVTRSQESNGKLPSVYAFSTYFYTRLAQGSSIGRWANKLDFFSYDLLLVPIHYADHWRLAVVDNSKKSIEYYDSLGGEFHHCINVLVHFLETESLNKKKQPLDLSQWQLMYKIPDIPMQANTYDCGVFTCIYAEYLSRRAPLTFTQKNIPDFRKLMQYEILHKKLLRS